MALQALPGRVKKLREGGMAALRELQDAGDRAAEAEADTKADLSRQPGDESEHLLGKAPLSTAAGTIA